VRRSRPLSPHMGNSLGFRPREKADVGLLASCQRSARSESRWLSAGAVDRAAEPHSGKDRSMTSSQPRRVRESPRASAQKLGEYVDVVSASRRERVVRDQKYPDDFIVIRYKDAFNSIRSSLLSGVEVQTRLGERAAEIGRRIATTRNAETTKACCVQALDKFSLVYPTLPLKGVTATIAPDMRLVIEGLRVSIQAAVMLTRTSRGGVTESGGLLLVFRKETPLGKKGGTVVAELLRRGLIAAAGRPVAHDLCLVVDVFAGLVFTPPTRSVRLNEEIESACREIVARWHAVPA
jgi:hypothetical protein